MLGQSLLQRMAGRREERRGFPVPASPPQIVNPPMNFAIATTINSTTATFSLNTLRG